MTVRELIDKLKLLPPDAELFDYISDMDEMGPRTAEPTLARLMRKNGQVRYLEERQVGVMNTYALEHWKDAEEFEGVIL